MCVSMLIGSTFAWFTDSVTSGNNKIVAGTLDIALYEVEPDPAALIFGGDPVKVIGEITNSSDPLFGEDIRWEPGYAAVSNLMLENKGNLALKWQAIVRPVADIGELADVIDVYVARQLLYTEHSSFEEHEDTLTKVGTLRDVMNGKAILSGAMEEKGDTEWFSIVLKMQETAGNEYQGKSAGAFDITILATQYTYENDSFNNQYDKDAVYGDVMVSTDAELKAAIENPNMKVIAVNGDLTYDWGGESYENSKALNMKGKTFLGANDAASITFAGYGSANPIVNATFKDITIKDSTVGDNEASWEHGYLEFKNLTAVNVTFANSIMMEGDFATFKNCSFNSNKDGEYAVWMANGDATFTNCIFTGTRGMKICDMYAPEIGTVVIDGCTFMDLTQKPGVAIDDNDTQDMKITIKNSTFINCQPGDQGLYIYETDNTVPTVENNIVESYKELVEIATKDQLVAFANRVNGGDGMSGVLVKLTDNIDLAGMEWTPIGQTGTSYGATNYFQGIFDGQGYTISNMTITKTNDGEHYAAGFFGFIDAADVTIRNINFDKANVAGNHWTAVVAGYLTGNVDNCNVTNSTVTCTHANDDACGDKAGAVVGYVNSGLVNNCSVSDTTVSAGRDAGQVVGASKTTYVANCTATNVTVKAIEGCTGANINNAIIGRVM